METNVEFRALKQQHEEDHRLLQDMQRKLRALIGPPHLGPGLGIAGDLTPVRGPALVHIDGTTYEMLTSGNGVLVSAFDAKGDILVGSGDDAYDNLTVGADGAFPIALASETLGINWFTFRLLNDITPSQITSDQDNYAPTGIATASVLRLSTDASRNITGITTGADGRVLILLNVGSNNVVLKDDTTSTAANRFQLNGDVTIRADSGCALWYDSTSSRWRLFTGGGSASPLTTKGDIYTYSTADDRLPVGTDGQFLSADSGETTGLKWVDAPTGCAYEPLTDGNSNFIFAGGDVVVVVDCT